jgi:ketosteroid isomerase-like protein
MAAITQYGRRTAMKRILVVSVAWLLCVGWAGAQDLLQELTKVENAWSEATVKRDTAALQRLYADEYISTDPTGAVMNKTQDIAGVQGGEFVLVSFKIDDLKVQSHGAVAVVTGRNTLKGTWKGKPVDGPYRFTDVFVKRDGRWQAVATQSTVIATPEK